MICESCTKIGRRAVDVFTQTERIQMLTSTATMVKFLEANPNAPHQDKVVANSIVTKLLLSFPEELRERLLQMLRTSAGVDITLKNCPHGVVTL